MIFDCGEDWATRKNRLEGWHDFFAIFPRSVGVVNGRVQCACLQTIERKGIFYGGYPYSMWVWSYRLKQAAATEARS